jgi:hypothetical protein
MPPWNTYFRTCSTCKFWHRYLANRNGICIKGVFPDPKMEYETCNDYKPIKKYGSQD